MSATTPALTVTKEGEAPLPSSTPRRRPTGEVATTKGRGTAARSPIASMADSQPSIPVWRVGVVIHGKCQWLGEIASTAGPEEVVRCFPDALPPVGSSADFLLQGVDQLGHDVGAPVPFTISGASPAVKAARAAIAPPAVAPAGSSVADRIALETLAARVERDAALIDSLRAETEALRASTAARERTLEEERRTVLTTAAADQQSAHERMLIQQRQQHDQAMESERERHRQAQLDREDRDRRDREERDRREAKEREDRDRRDAADREYRTQLAAIQAANSMESTVTKVTAVLKSVGVDVGAILGKVVGGGDAPVTDGGIPAAVALVVGKFVDQTGEIVKQQLAIQQTQLEREGGGSVQVMPRRPQLPPVRPVAPRFAHPQPGAAPKPPAAAAAPEAPAPAAAPPPSTTSTTSIPMNDPALAGIDLPVIRKARLRLRSLASELAGSPPDRWDALILAAGAAEPSLLVYVRAVGLSRAAAEAGFSSEHTATLAAKAALLGVT